MPVSLVSSEPPSCSGDETPAPLRAAPTLGASQGPRCRGRAGARPHHVLTSGLSEPPWCPHLSASLSGGDM